MSQKKLDELIEFVKFTHKFQEIKRHIWVTGGNRQENDAEHTFQITLAIWYICEKDNLDLDINLVIKYALIHDLVETYAGDVANFDETSRRNKKILEQKAAARIKREFPKFKNLHTLIHKYEEKSDKESRLVYALEKIIPSINVYLDKGRTWKDEGMTFEKFDELKKEKVGISKEGLAYYRELKEVLQKDTSNLFAKELDLKKIF